MSEPITAVEFTIVCVCTGNICRSPAAERLLASALGPSVQVVSAGTYAMTGQPISPPMDALVERAGAFANGFAARQLNEVILKPADLVLAMTREHRAASVELWPATVRRAFTLRQFARLLTLVDPADLPAGSAADRLRAAIPLAAAARGRSQPTAAEDDVGDPYRRGDDVYRIAFDEIKAAVHVIGRTICPAAA